jgi:UDP-N-acetylmuramate dehydrogenase
MTIEPESRSLSDSTTLQIGGWTDQFYEIGDRSELREVLSQLSEPDEAVILGRGSNTLFPDGKFERPVLKLVDSFDRHEFEEQSVKTGSAVFFPELALEAARHGFGGLEWAAGVPGSVGGAVAMNAGAFQVQTSEILDTVEFMNYQGEILNLTCDEIEFDYRSCELRDRGFILSATFELDPDPSESVMDKTKSLLRKRRREQPVGTSSAGCIFKNVNGHSAGKLIDDAGLKGVSHGDVEVSEQHANYFVNHGDGTYEDLVNLIERVREEVDKQFGYELEPELQIVNED